MLPPNIHSPIKDGRRILSEKSVNACLSPASSPVKRSLVNSSPKKRLLPSPSFVAQKRPIAQLEDENQNNGSLRVQRVESQTETRLANPHAQNEPPPVLGDKQSPDAMDYQHQHQYRLPDTTTEPKRTTNTTIPEDPQTRKLFIQEKATLLRTRLQNAMRHVRDPQFDRRLSELEAHSRKCPRLSGPTFLPPLPSHALPTLNQDEQTTDDEDGEIYCHATILTTPQPHPQSQSQTEVAVESEAVIPAPSTSEQEDDPMKTPTQKSHSQAMAHSHRRTITAESLPATASVLTLTPTSPMHLGSPPAPTNPNIEEEGEGERDSITPDSTTQRISPSQRGDAVDGLLKLMNTGEGSSSDAWMG